MIKTQPNLFVNKKQILLLKKQTIFSIFSIIQFFSNLNPTNHQFT